MTQSVLGLPSKQITLQRTKQLRDSWKNEESKLETESQAKVKELPMYFFSCASFSAINLHS